MIRPLPSKAIPTITLALFLLSLSGIAEARGRGGSSGGGFSRGGAASSGSFSRGGGGSSEVGARGGSFQRPSGSSGGQQGMRQPTGQFSAPQEKPSPGQWQGQAGASQRQTQRQETAGGMQDSASQRQTQREQSASDMQQDRQDYHTENREDWQNQQDKNREDWQDYADDRYWDYHWHGNVNQGAAFVAGAAVGAAAASAAGSTTTYVAVLPCSYTTVFINGATYYRCGSTWYSRGYVNNNVTYVVVSPPPGF